MSPCSVTDGIIRPGQVGTMVAASYALLPVNYSLVRPEHLSLKSKRGPGNACDSVGWDRLASIIARFRPEHKSKCHNQWQTARCRPGAGQESADYAPQLSKIPVILPY